MKYKFSEFLSLSSTERKGVILLIALILIVIAVQVWIAFSPGRELVLADTMLLKEVHQFEKEMMIQNPVAITRGNDSFADAEYIQAGLIEPTELFVFDPNRISVPDMKRLGLDSRLIRTIVNYRNKGGRFYQPSDLNKIYGMNSLIYERLKPYINIPGIEHTSSFSGRTEITGINKADSADLESISGIGPVLARRIVRYRELLGGFYDLQQLQEVYGLNDTLINRISERFFADSANVTRISVNTATEQQMARHPYIGKYISKGIIAFRKHSGEIKDMNELLVNGLITSDQLQKIARYAEP